MAKKSYTTREEDEKIQKFASEYLDEKKNVSIEDILHHLSKQDLELRIMLPIAFTIGMNYAMNKIINQPLNDLIKELEENE